MRFTWVVGSGRALSVRVDEPEPGGVRGGLVIVPPVSGEEVVAHRALRALAVRAASRGLIAISPSLTGEGDSEGMELTADLASAWVEDLLAVTSFARELLEGQPLTVLGLRLGAAVVASLPEPACERRILWEPVTGRSHVRQHRAARRFVVKAPPVADGVEFDAGWYTTEQADSLTLLPHRPFSRQPEGSEIVREDGPQGLRQLVLNSPHYATIPYPSLDRLIDTMPLAEPRPARPWQPLAAVELRTHGAPGVRETHCLVGPDSLPGILTTGSAGTHRAAVVFTAMGVGLKCGPDSLWAKAARDLAGTGTVSLRVDRRPLGDALDVTKAEAPYPYSEEAVEDCAVAARWLGDHTGRGVTAVGICSGAWSFLQAARTSPIRHVLSVNSIDWNPDPLAYDQAYYEESFRQESEFNAIIEESSEPISVAAARGRQSTLIREVFRSIALRFPRLVALVKRDSRMERVSWLLDYLPRGCSVDLVMGDWEYSRFRLFGGVRDVKRLGSRGVSGRIVKTSALDHSLLSERARRYLRDYLADRIDELYGPADTGGDTHG